jgi:hypothetical protein
MDAKIIAVKNQGDFNKEFAFIQILEDCELGEFILADSTFTETGKASNKIRHTYWFPNRKVKKGDFVALHTTVGKDSKATSADGSTTHRFHWGLNVSVWNDEGDCAVLLRACEWQLFEAAK